MKIEMGESLIYSWLRHEKQCQLAQTNWKSSSYWELLHYDELVELEEELGESVITSKNATQLNTIVTELIEATAKEGELS